LGVLPLVDGPRLRPLIEARKSDITAHLARHAIRFASDPSNANPRYLRTRVRHDVLPLLASLNPRIVLGLTSLADEALLLPKEAPLPRATREGLRRLDSGTAPKKMRVTLPGGLVLSGGQTNDSGVALERGQGLICEPDRAVQSPAGTVESMRSQSVGTSEARGRT
jgi:tRNA(Ile)-lysidine synthase